MIALLKRVFFFFPLKSFLALEPPAMCMTEVSVTWNASLTHSCNCGLLVPTNHRALCSLKLSRAFPSSLRKAHTDPSSLLSHPFSRWVACPLSSTALSRAGVHTWELNDRPCSHLSQDRHGCRVAVSRMILAPYLGHTRRTGVLWFACSLRKSCQKT